MPSSPSLTHDNKQAGFNQNLTTSAMPSTLEGKSLPNNIDAEQGLLAACIVDSSGEVIGRCIEQGVGPDHFHFHNHQLIFDALIQLHQENDMNLQLLLSQ